LPNPNTNTKPNPKANPNADPNQQLLKEIPLSCSLSRRGDKKGNLVGSRCGLGKVSEGNGWMGWVGERPCKSSNLFPGRPERGGILIALHIILIINHEEMTQNALDNTLDSQQVASPMKPSLRMHIWRYKP